MISNKNYLFLSLSFFFSASLSSQTVDPSLLSELTPEQIEVAKKALQEGDLTLPEVNELPEVTESLVGIKDQVIGEEIDAETEEEIELVKYGYDFFSKMPTSLSAAGDLPLPNDYKISLRDQFRIILSGSRDQIFNLSVNLDGTILFPELGSIYVVGLTFKEVREKLSNLVNQSYIGVNIDISLQNLSAKIS